ncbi:MAG TPA: hypothetical protein VMX79_03895 [bacterium]|nr:hypothetical protein [bacterium]
MDASVRKDIVDLLEAGDAAAALERCRLYWDETGGPPRRTSGDDSLRELNCRLTVWEQIELYVGEVNRRPDNPRSWKLLGYAYMWAGSYIPVLLRAAEQALLASAAREDDAAMAANLEENMELCRQALAGGEDARAEIAGGERLFAETFGELPAEVSMPDPFVAAGIVGSAALKVAAAVIAPDLLDILDR